MLAGAMQIRLRPRHDRRLRRGHPWVFANEIDGDVAALPRGGVVDVTDARGEHLGRGTANPASLIAVRVLTRDRSDDPDSAAFYARRLREALARRERVCPGRRSLRLVHGEGDDLPGLVVDRYGDHVVAQLGTLGMELRKDLLEAALREVVAPAGAVLRSEGPARRLEGLEDERRAWFGEVPDETEIEESGVRFGVGLLEGQKTGHFHDQAPNRAALAPLCRGADVLDVYANSGGFGLHALVAGAASCLFVDRSAQCAEAIRANAARNGVAERARALVADGKDTLQQLVRDGRRFGVVMLDPPAFAKTRKAAGAALKGYLDVNALGMRLVEPGGLLATSSCSWHVEEERFLEVVVEAAARAGRRLALVRRGEQGPDHVIRPEIPETRYLKHLVFRVE
jgi:23S rRNA (cytosine1962-C5)-methyltransferase